MTIYRCFGGHVDEALSLATRDRDGLTRGEEAGKPMPLAAAPGQHTAGSTPAPGSTSKVTVLPSGACLISLGPCPHCGVMGGFSSPQEHAQAAIADWQQHVAECRGGVL